MGADDTEHVRVVEGELKSAGTTHRQTTDCAMRCIGQGTKRRVDLAPKVARHVIAPARAAIDPVHPVAEVTLRHDDDERLDVLRLD